ncbi:MAG: response regulator [Labilithrix sp.]|nr:response regulator [Labilithrix sp.]
MVRRILVVEDSASTRSLVRAILEDPAFAQAVGPVEVTEAQSGFDAMRLLPRARYDLIITDINMPDVNGLELIHFIRRSEQYRATPLVIISTQATERDVERARKLGANAYVPKPFTPASLRGACEKLLSSSGEGGAHASASPASSVEVPPAPSSGSGR